MTGNEEVDQTLEDKRGWGLRGMNSAHDKDDLFGSDLSVLCLILQAGSRIWIPGNGQQLKWPILEKSICFQKSPHHIYMKALNKNTDSEKCHFRHYTILLNTE